MEPAGSVPGRALSAERKVDSGVYRAAPAPSGLNSYMFDAQLDKTAAHYLCNY